MKRPPTSSTTCSCSCAAAGAPWQTRSVCSMSAAPSATPRLPAIDLPVQPALEEVRAMARAPGQEGGAPNLIPLRHSFIADCETPVSAFLKLRELAPGEPSFLLESAEQGQRMGRYSFIGFRPRSVLRWSLGDPGDPYALAAAAVAACRQAALPDGVGGSPFNAVSYTHLRAHETRHD